MTIKFPMPATVLSAAFLVGALGSAKAVQGQPISTIVNAQQKLQRATVEDTAGRPIGKIDRLEPATGTPLNARVALDLSSGTTKLVTIAAADLRYDPKNNVVESDLPNSEINAMTNGTSQPSTKP